MIRERQGLINGVDPLLDGPGMVRECDFFPADEDIAFGGLIDAGQDLDQGRFACAIIALRRRTVL